ncbi:MAG: phosphoethanolamine transferase [Alphaproteobacteria bacterium]|nr:phosphoethanolamine transferase [Alphaproteobacteria bacterium]
MQIHKLLSKKDITNFLAYFLGFYLIILLARFFTTAGHLNLFMWQGYQLLFALAFASSSVLFKYQKKHTLLFLFVALLWGASCLCKIGANMVLNEREIVQTIGIGTIFYTQITLLLYFFSLIKNRVLARILRWLSLILFALLFLPPLLVIGYYIVSNGRMLSSNILLTIFQTNIGEIYAYLAEQNIVLWIVSVIAILVLTFIISYLLSTIKINFHFRKSFVFNTILVIYLTFCIVPKLSSSFVVNMFIRVSDTLAEYKSYAKLSAQRNLRLTELQKILDSNKDAQLHVLVVGESTVRHHLAAFGYKKPTTPWLSKIVQENKNTIIYPKAYSSNIQTVMSVQFALTSQNQYNATSLQDAYTLTEVASASDYETYWISNQMHFEAYDTPISAISNGADHRVFINDYYGSKLLTTYYDEKLADQFPKINPNKKVLIIFHLMGCHNLYIDRYPSSFKTFDGDNARVNTYDNCILYNDYVLSLLYQKAAENENFMSFTFLSDHGEDPDKGLTHDYSKFTWNMSHIPFVTIFSEKYAAAHPKIIDTLKANKDKYWTSDLLFDTMTHILGINNIPNSNPRFDISKKEYSMNKDNLTIIEGTYNIKDDDSDN